MEGFAGEPRFTVYQITNLHSSRSYFHISGRAAEGAFQEVVVEVRPFKMMADLQFYGRRAFIVKPIYGGETQQVCIALEHQAVIEAFQRFSVGLGGEPYHSMKLPPDIEQQDEPLLEANAEIREIMHEGE
jgi:hypothetical protein